MRVLVTGAAGFLGASVSRELEARGHSVTRVVRSVAPGGVLVDLSESGEFLRRIADAPDVVVHLAAAVPRCSGSPESEHAAAINRRIDDEVFHTALLWRSKTVYASSTSVYGNVLVKSEKATLEPKDSYAAAKLESERRGRKVLGGAGLPFSALRINAPYGPGQKMETVIYKFIRHAINGERLLFRGDGTRQQDFTFIEDVARAVRCAAESHSSGVFNVAGGNPVSMANLARLVVKMVPGTCSEVGPAGEPDPQNGYMNRFTLDAIHEALGWTPEISLEKGILLLSEWMKGPQR